MPDERVDIADCLDMVRIYLLLIRDISALPEAAISSG
jgi:acetylornithine deacetylase/succinyl-diaminopimelate desuccinylase-like protein